MIKVYDNAGFTACRYTVLFLDEPERDGFYRSISLSDDPAHPTGCAIHGVALDGKHLGRRVSFDNLPYKARQYLERATLHKRV